MAKTTILKRVCSVYVWFYWGNAVFLCIIVSLISCTLRSSMVHRCWCHFDQQNNVSFISNFRYMTPYIEKLFITWQIIHIQGQGMCSDSSRGRTWNSQVIIFPWQPRGLHVQESHVIIACIKWPPGNSHRWKWLWITRMSTNKSWRVEMHILTMTRHIQVMLSTAHPMVSNWSTIVCRFICKE